MTEKSFEKERAAVLTKWSIDKATSVMKEAKEEILTTAWKTPPSPEQVEKFEYLDQYIRHYLIKHFNPNAYTWMKITPDDTLFIVKSLAEGGKPAATISTDKVKEILVRKAEAAPRFN